MVAAISPREASCPHGPLGERRRPCVCLSLPTVRAPLPSSPSPLPPPSSSPPAEQEADGAEEDEIEDADEEEEAPKTKMVTKTVSDWELINDAKALWTRNPSDITKDEYKAFYQSLTKDVGEPLTHTHFSAEGEVEFKSILYIPKEAPQDLYNDYYKKQVAESSARRLGAQCTPLTPLTKALTCPSPRSLPSRPSRARRPT